MRLRVDMVFQNGTASIRVVFSRTLYGTSTSMLNGTRAPGASGMNESVVLASRLRRRSFPFRSYSLTSILGTACHLSERLTRSPTTVFESPTWTVRTPMVAVVGTVRTRRAYLVVALAPWVEATRMK